MQKLAGKIEFYDFTHTLGLEMICGTSVRHNFARHTHRNMCIGIVEQGVRIILCRKVRYEVAPGQVFIIPPGEVHSCVAEGEAHTYRLFLIAPDLLNMILPNFAEGSYKFKNLVFDDKKRYAQLVDLHKILINAETNFFKQSALISTLGDVIEYCTEFDIDLNISNNQYDSVKRVQNYIETNYAKRLSLGDIACYAYLSPYYLIRVFSQIIGIPPHIYQQQIRIRRSKEMLSDGIPIIEVAFRTGFTDQSHFSNAFKRMVGITPGEYIKSNQIDRDSDNSTSDKLV